ncbi:Adenine phosphoribosyltransferase 5 isoform 1 [Hibiscus syriacus]|uniref:Adenine phosphoribosyltransferase 5 isoform 1 n=1 Tax=Hibiscus syriacus TaxID=106335 RepID=A0A6A2Z7K5_HIBSY|nr:Adenine phosphoribosyltransferase 5 isoform 1 [Hibiscus syriacus]
MIQRRSPPKHRHDGTSPLPLGMDWSPPPLNGGSVLQGTDWVTITRGLKAAFPKKSLPPATQGVVAYEKQGFAGREKVFIGGVDDKLLSDIDLSRSVTVASFLELEGAARSDYGSDTAYETSELGSPRLGRDDSSDIGFGDLTLDEDLSGSIEKFVKYAETSIVLQRKKLIMEMALELHFLAVTDWKLFSEPEPAKMVGHAQKLSIESVGSDLTSLRGSDMGNSRIPDSSVDLPGASEVSSTMATLGKLDSLFSGGTQIFLPLDQRQKMNRVLTMQQRLVTAKTDMEDLIARLNQEIAVKGYLTTKVKDLEVELESTKQKSRENLQQAILIERDRFTQMQWEMEELRRKSLEMELKSNPKQDEMQITETTIHFAAEEKDAMLQELNATKEQLNSISKQYEELEAKSRADIKLLVKEVQLEHERQTSKHVKTAREELLNECRLLHNSLLSAMLICPQMMKFDQRFFLSRRSMDLLTTSDDKITLLLAEVQLLAKEDATAIEDVNNLHDSHYDGRIDDELRKIIADIFTDNAKLKAGEFSTTVLECDIAS